MNYANWSKCDDIINLSQTRGGSSPIHTADADATKLFCRVASASAVCTGHYKTIFQLIVVDDRLHFILNACITNIKTFYS